jgi:uracil-DNA glycosylase
MNSVPAEAAPDCRLCPRLVAYRDDNRQAHPDWFNGAVPSFGSSDAELLIIGLAPGVTGANRTGRPFTGDWAGDLLYTTLDKFGFSSGTYNRDYDRHTDDGLTLNMAMITNAVRCVPPQNKPVGAEIKQCRPFLQSRIAALPRLRVMLALGKIAHDSTIAAFNKRQKEYPFGHGNRHVLDGLLLYDSYHCSRYNTNTGRLTADMFEDVFAAIRKELG